MPHIHDKIDFTADVFVVHKNKVLLRMHDKYHMWLCVGGHIELDENPNQAALREVKEEVGLDIRLVGDGKIIDDTDGHTELIRPRFLNIHRINANHQHVGLVYFATSDTDHVIPERPEDKWKWVAAGELDAMDLKPHVRLYAGYALRELGQLS